MLALKLQIALMNDNIEITYADIFELNTIKKLAKKIDKHTVSISKKAEKYDFSKINELLEVNSPSSLENLSGINNIGNIVLTGSTGFLGAHILSYILENTNLKVYCLLRNNPSINIDTKLLRKLNYYFGDKYDNLLNNRFFAIACDITQKNLGLNTDYIDLLNQNTSCIINSAAIVKHFGDYADFESVNVAVVKNIVDFCKKYNKKLVQISTTSVSGNTLFDTSINKSDFTEDVDFDETKLYIGQSLENVYVRSKFEAERIILKNIVRYNLDALILRIGNITNRAIDGKFQPNSNENAFANRLKAFIKLKCIPNYLSDIYAEFSPVDDVAKAVFMSILYAKNINVLHIYNSNHVYMKELISMLPHGLIEFVDNDVFDKKLEDFISNGESTNEISSLINDIDGQKHLSYDNKIKIKNDFSNLFLQKIGFEWSAIDKDYINKLLKNL